MKADRKELIQALAPCKAALDGGSDILELKQFWFDKKYVYANNGDLAVKVPLGTDLDLGLPGNELLGLLNSYAADDVVLSGKPGHAVTLTVGKSNLKLASITSDRRVWRFPDDPAKSAVVSVELTEAVIKGLELASIVKRSKPTRVDHYGVMLALDEGTELYTTDSMALLQVTVPTKKRRGFDGYKTILPFPLVKQITTWCPAGAMLHCTNDCLVVIDKKICLYSKLHDMSTALNLAKYCRTELDADPVWFKLPGTLDKLVQRATILAGSEEPYVDLTVDGTSLFFDGVYDYGELKETLSLQPKARNKQAITTLASWIAVAAEHAREFAIGKQALLFRDENFFFMVAAHDRKKHR